MIYGYIRVSTEKQTVQNQKFEIRKYCKQHKIDFGKVVFIQETASGIKDPKKRELNKLLMELKPKDTLIVTEVSRLGRKIMMVMNIIYSLVVRGIKVVAIKQGYEFKNDKISLLMAFVFAFSADDEHDLISMRTKVALKRKQSEGLVLGRQKGYHPKNYKLTGKEKYIYNKLKHGMSKNALAKELHVEWETLNVFVNTNKGYKKYIRSVV